MDETAAVTFVPAGVTVAVPVGTTVLEAARRAGLPLPSTCGGQGTCGDCAVRVLSGDASPPGETERLALRSAPPGVRLACMLHVRGDLTVRPVAPFVVPGGKLGIASRSAEAVAAAVDLGTTTITAALIDTSGSETASGTADNPQRTYGGDVASRIAAAVAGEARELQSLALRGVESALAIAGGASEGVSRLVIAGNSAMTHLALGAEVAGLADHPFTGTVGGLVRSTAAALGLELLAANTEVVFLPGIAAFVGGDTTAGILASRLDRPQGVRVLLDLGTNAEVVVSSDGALTVTSAAAGPAFEAAGLACGGPAGLGAVRDVRSDGGSLVLDVIGEGSPQRLCGSGALALVAALLEAGHIDPTGRLVSEGPLASRFHHRGDVLALQVSGEPGGDPDVYLTQLDIRELQLAKAAVATALELTLLQAAVAWSDVSEVLVAGAFGAGVDERLLRRLGVLPARGEVTVRAVGNASLAGAELVAHDEALERRAEEIAASARWVDLAAHTEFRRRFVAHTELRELQ